MAPEIFATLVNKMTLNVFIQWTAILFILFFIRQLMFSSWHLTSAGLERPANTSSVYCSGSALDDDDPILNALLRARLGQADRRRFPQLAARKAEPTDPEVLRLARQMLVPPYHRDGMKLSRWIEYSMQARVVDKILGNKTNGFFVECGGYDGETASNTIHLERRRNWTGLLIEMDPNYYIQLVAKSRHAWIINAALSIHKHVDQMKFLPSNGQLGQLLISDQLRVSRQINNSAFCFPLVSLLRALNQLHVDYLSLDVEGYELEVLRTIPFNELEIDVISVEFVHGKSGRPRYISYMQSQGYRFHSEVSGKNSYQWAGDLIFVRNGLKTWD